MTLASLIRKHDPEALANANPANAANDSRRSDGSLAALATLSLATPTGDESAPVRRWSVAFPDLDPVEVVFTPEATRAEVAAIYPGARIEALLGPTRRAATSAEAAELRALVRVVLADAPQEWDAVTAVALADPEAALTSFRVLAAEARERAIWGA